MTTTNWITVIGAASGIIALINFSFKKPKARDVIKALTLIVLSVILVILSFNQNKKDRATSKVVESKSDSVHLLLRSLNDSTLSINRKLATIGVLTDYIKKVDSIGIKRDTIKNAPIVTKAFNNYINKVGTLNQY